MLPSINRVLMCAPTYYDIEYSINPWMDTTRRVDKRRAHSQWEHARRTLESLQVTVELIEPQPGLPDMTFVGDAGILVGNKFLASNFRHSERQGESLHYRQWFSNHGYEVLEIPQELFFEGLGDVVVCDREVIVGYGPRSSPGAVAEMQRLLPELETRAEVELCDERFFHTGLCIAFLRTDVVLYYPPAFTPKSQRIIRESFDHSIAVSEIDAVDHFACNNIPLGNNILVGGLTAELEHRLGELGFRVHRCEMDEFTKSGGSVRCLILNLE